MELSTGDAITTPPLARRHGGVGETNGAYPDVVAMLQGGKGRVIVCPAGIQWVVQRRRGHGWESQSFCRTKEVLLRCSGEPDHPALSALPDRIVERERNCA